MAKRSKKKYGTFTYKKEPPLRPDEYLVDNDQQSWDESEQKARDFGINVDQSPTPERSPDANEGWEVVDHGDVGHDDGWEVVDHGDVSPEQESGPDRPGEAALQGFGQAGTFGYLPHLQTMSEPVTDRLFGLIPGYGDVEKAPMSQVVPGTKEYLEARDRNLDRDQSLRESNPKSYIGGAAAETALELPFDGPIAASKYLKNVPKIGKTLAKSSVTKGVVDAGTQGLIFNPGDKKGEMNPLQWDERATNAADSMEFAGELGLGLKGTQGLVKASKNLPGYLKKKSNNMALRAAGYMLKDRRRIGGGKSDIAETIYREGMLPVGGSVEDIAKNAGKVVNESGQKLDETYLKLDAARDAVKKGEVKGVKKKDLRGFHPKKQYDEIESRVRARLGDMPDREKAVKKVMGYVDQLSEDYPKGMPPSASRKAKAHADQVFDYDKNPLNKTKNATQIAHQELANHIRDKIDQQAVQSKKVLKGEDAKTLRTENKRMHRSLDIEKTAKDRVLRNETNHPVGLIPTILGSSALRFGLPGAAAGAGANYSENPDDIAGHVVMGLVGAGMGMAGKKYGPGIVGHGTRAASKVLGPVLNNKLTRAASEASGHGIIRGASKVRNVRDQGKKKAIEYEEDEDISRAEQAINDPNDKYHRIADRNDVMGTAMRINFFDGMESGGVFGTIKKEGELLAPKFGKPGGINPFGAEVRPFQSSEAREDAAYAKKSWQKFLDQKNTIGKMVNPDDLSAGVIRPKRDELSRFTDKAASKMAGKLNLEKAKAGELHKEWPYLDRQPFQKEAFDTARTNYTNATKQLQQNSEDFKKWGKKLYEGNPSKEEIKLYEEMQNDHDTATRNVRGHLGGYSSGPLPPKPPGDKIDAKDAFEMWGGRPTEKGKPAGVIKERFPKEGPASRGGYELREEKNNPWTGQRTIQVYKNGKWVGTHSGTRKTNKDILDEWNSKK